MDLSGTPISLLSAMVGVTQGQIGCFVNKYLDYKYQSRLAENKAMQDLRKIKSPGFVFTRRIITLIPFIYVFGGCLIAAIYNIPVFTSYSEINGSLASWFMGPSKTMLKELHGLVIIPVMTYIMGLEAVFYFDIKR
jgi:hypothetical protein